MKKAMRAASLVFLLTVFLVGGAQATDIFFWQHDNNLRVQDRVFNTTLTSTQSLTRTLDQLDLDYTLNRNMPDDLSGYDLFMTSLSFYCPG